MTRVTFRAKIKINRVQKSYAQHIYNCTKGKNVRRPYCYILTVIVTGVVMNANFFTFSSLHQILYLMNRCYFMILGSFTEEEQHEPRFSSHV